MKHGARTWLAAAVLALVGTSAPAAAHDGPPYPVFVDEDLAGWTLSVWVDPDVGEGTFYYYLDAPAGAALEQVEVLVRSRPLDGSSDPVQGTSEPAHPGEPFQLVGRLPFAERGTWRTDFVLRQRDADPAELGSLHIDLEVTPPGLGPADLLLYSLPFLAVAGLWLRALLAQRAHDRRSSSPADLDAR